MALRRRKQPFIRLNTEDILCNWRVTWTISGWTATDMQGRVIESTSISGLYYRRPYLPVPVDGTADVAGGFVMREASAFLRGLYAHTAGRWISNPASIEAAEDKMLQLRVAERLGFCVPRTMVTNNPADARVFVASVGLAIVKPLSSGRLCNDPTTIAYTMPLNQDDNLEAVVVAPHLLQERVPKIADVRVTVVDDQVFACRINSQQHAGTALDWRTATSLGVRLEHRIVTLPNDLVHQCTTLVRELGLRFGAIDLVERNDGYSFLEINPNGQWAWIEQLTGAPIADAIAGSLLKRDVHSAA